MSERVYAEDIDIWLDSLTAENHLEVFKALSEYLSAGEIRNIMNELGKGSGLLSAHRKLGLVEKYQTDLMRIRNLVLL